MLSTSSCAHSANVWTNENRIGSDSNVKDECLPLLGDEATEPESPLAKIDGQARLNGVFKWPVFQDGKLVTTDGFDQSQLYYSITSLELYLMELGFNIPEVLGSQHNGKPHPIVAHANATNDLNAWFSPQDDDLTFGTADNKWHLASDGDVSVHETGHMILHHYNPGFAGWSSKEGGAIHEGFSDALAALFYNDPHMSEDFVPLKGRPENKDDGLRIVDHNLTLDDVTWEVHDRGRVYAGFFWSIKKMLEDASGPFKLPSQRAASLTLMIAMNHAANYKTSSPDPVDFVTAILSGTMALFAAKKLPVDKKMLAAVIIEEAMRRKLLTSSAGTNRPKNEFRSVEAVEQYLASLGSPVKFHKAHKVGFIGGTAEFYQQQVVTQKFGAIDFIGRGIWVHRDMQGNIVSVSVKDVLPVRADQVSGGGQISTANAANLALENALKRRDAITSNLKRLGMARGRIPLEYISNLQMEAEISRTELQNLQKVIHLLKSGNRVRPRLVFIDGGRTPAYEFKTGLSIFYVDSATGAVSRYKDVIVN